MKNAAPTNHPSPTSQQVIHFVCPYSQANELLLPRYKKYGLLQKNKTCLLRHTHQSSSSRVWSTTNHIIKIPSKNIPTSSIGHPPDQIRGRIVYPSSAPTIRSALLPCMPRKATVSQPTLSPLVRTARRMFFGSTRHSRPISTLPLLRSFPFNPRQRGKSKHATARALQER